MKTSNSQSIKLENTRLVMEKIIELRDFTRIELSRLTTLNKATISTIISDLLDRELITETKQLIRTSGRSANVFSLNKNAGRIISIELLTDSIYGIITNFYGEILFETTMKVPDHEFRSYLTVLLQVVDELKLNTYDSVYGIIGIGLAVYGIVSNDEIVKFAPSNNWRDIDFKTIIEDYTGIETYVQNESNISALGEIAIHKNLRNIVSFHAGNGVGMGIAVNGSLYSGEDGYAGEIGHTIVVPNGRKCVCGNHGCLERYMSFPSILNDYYELSGDIVTIDEFINLYKQDCEHAIKIYNQYTIFASIAINNISQTLNPHTIIIQSKIVDEIPETISDIRNRLKSQVMNLEILTTSKFKTKMYVLGLTHILIQKFLGVDTYKITSYKHTWMRLQT